MSSLSEDQLKRIAENKKKALEKLANKANQSNSGKPNTSIIKEADCIKSISVLKSKADTFYSQKPFSNKIQNSSKGSHNPTFNSMQTFSKNFNSMQNSSLNKITDDTKVKFNETTGIKAICEIVDRTKFQIITGYHQQAINIFRSMKSKNYDASTKRWSFSINEHDKLILLLQPLYPSFHIIPLPKYVIHILTKNSESIDIDLSRLDPLLLETLMPFQKEGVKFGISRDGRVLIADDMGLGKTIQAIAIADYYRAAWPLVVVSPSSMRYSWAEAFERHISYLAKEQICVLDSSKDDIDPRINIIIISFDLLSKLFKKLEIIKFGIVIFDESHFLKNYKAIRTKAAQAISLKVKHIILLSGTPALSRPIELYTQISLIKPQLFNNVHSFGKRYCNGKVTQWGDDYSGSSNMKELQHILEATVMIRRLKTDVITQLPDKIRQMIILDPSSLKIERKSLMGIKKKMDNVSLKGMERRGVLLEYFRETAVSKLSAICDYICELVEKDRKFLCFAHHQIIINGICDTLMDKCAFIKIDGSTPSEERKELCDKFQFNSDYKVAVLSITAANAGITLTAANLVVFAELFWNPGILMQAEDRVHRIGQLDSVLVQYLVARGTADDHIWPLVKQKLAFLKEAGLSKDNFSEAETKSLQDPKQKTIEEMFEALSSENVDWITELDLTGC